MCLQYIWSRNYRQKETVVKKKFFKEWFGRAESREIEDVFPQKDTGKYVWFWVSVDRWWKKWQRNLYIHNNNLTGRRAHDSRSDAGNKPAERHGSSFQDQLQILESEGTVSECSQVVANINSSASGLPPQRTRSVRKGNCHKHEIGVMHPSELALEQEAH